MQEASDAFEPKGEEKMMETLRHEFPDATIMTIGFHPALERFHDRRLCLERAENARLVPISKDGS